VKTLLLCWVRSPSERRRIAGLEAADAHPRHLHFEDTLSGDVLDSGFVQTAPRVRRLIYRRLPPWVCEVLEVYARRRRYDAVVSWSERSALLFALLLKLTFSRTRHVTLVYWVSPPKKALLFKLVQSHIDHIVTWSTVQRAFMIERLRIPPARITLTHFPVDQRYWRPMGTPTDMICAAGNEMRDYPTFIEAMRGLDIPCHIAVRDIPPGTSRKLATSAAILARENLPPNITVGPKTYPELRALYARSRFVVIPLKPTDTDNGVSTILEVMAMGRAVICSRVKGQVDVIEDGKTGIYVTQGDPQALRQAIQFLWDRPELADQMGREARRRVEARLNLDDFAQTVRTAVENVIAQPRLALT
jgi:glycosyltransferase involved in cell wall biosynthesis